MTRTRFPAVPRFIPALTISLSPFAGSNIALADDEPPGKPNIVYILADDLGYAELGCYGQEKIRTPNIDRLAAEGMLFTQHYSGSPVCAPSRCTLLTGKHTGHAYIRDNHEMGGWERDAREGQLHLPEGTTTLGTLLQQAGYRTCAVGKWGLGGPDTTGHPNLQGFDHWYGYLCQRVAHNYYPTHLWRNGEKDILEGNDYFSAHQRLDEPPEEPAGWDRFKGQQYAPDLMAAEALDFIRENKDGPFFLYFATTVPHAALQVPEDSLEPYLAEGWDEQPYLGGKGYLPHPAPRAAYAAMVSRMDQKVGRIMALLEELELDDDTIIIFSSDNGPTFNGGTDSGFFRSAGPLRGLKCSVYEGGVRVPMIARWPGRIEPGAVSDHVSAFWDILPTICALTGVDEPAGLDGISIAPILLGQPEQQKEHQYLYWEYHGSQAARMGPWKGVLRRGKDHLELYNLDRDVAEQQDVAAENPEVAVMIRGIMTAARTESEHFPLKVK